MIIPRGPHAASLRGAALFAAAVALVGGANAADDLGSFVGNYSGAYTILTRKTGAVQSGAVTVRVRQTGDGKAGAISYSGTVGSYPMAQRIVLARNGISKSSITVPGIVAQSGSGTWNVLKNGALTYSLHTKVGKNTFDTKVTLKRRGARRLRIEGSSISCECGGPTEGIPLAAQFSGKEK